MSVFHILVVDNDQWTVKMVSSLLSRRGHRVAVARSASEAESQLALGVPDLVIADAHIESEGLAWLTRLRVEAGRRRLPMLILADDAPPSLRMDALRLPYSDFLDKPFRFDEFDLRVERLLQSPVETNPGEELPRPQGLRGTLGDLSLASILLLIESEQKSGVLTVRRPGEVGRLWCAAGRLMSAELSVTGGRPERSLEAVFMLLSWTSAEFEFVAGSEQRGDDEGLPITQLVLLLAQRQDESARRDAVAV